jgi:hypothetical protein
VYDNHWIEREGPDGKMVQVFDHAFRRSKQQIAALQLRLSVATVLRQQETPQAGRAGILIGPKLEVHGFPPDGPFSVSNPKNRIIFCSLDDESRKPTERPP